MSEKKRTLIVSVCLGSIALAAIIGARIVGSPPAASEPRETAVASPVRAEPATSGDEVPATPERLCDDEAITAESTELFSVYEGTPLHALYTTDRYRVMLIVLPQPCSGTSDHPCFVCAAALIGDPPDGVDVMDICTQFGAFVRSTRVLPEGVHEAAVDQYVTLDLAGMVHEMTGDRICNLRYEFDAGQLFSETPPDDVIRMPPAPPGSISI